MPGQQRGSSYHSPHELSDFILNIESEKCRSKEKRHLQENNANLEVTVCKPNVYSNSRKEVFQPHLPVRLPCYDLAPITSFALGRSSR